MAHLFDQSAPLPDPVPVRMLQDCWGSQTCISSCVITKIAAAASATFCVRLETEVPADSSVFHALAVNSGTLRDVWAGVGAVSKLRENRLREYAERSHRFRFVVAIEQHI